MNPSAADILEAIEAVPTDDVLVLPNNGNVILTAEQAAALSDKSVRVIPSGSVQAGFAAMSRFVSTASPKENESAMLEELEAASTGEITVASRDATLDGVEIREGAYLGLVDDVAVASGPDLDTVVHDVVDRVLAGGQGFLTILTGEDAPPLDGLVSALEARHPDLEVEIHEGGQPHYPLLVVAQ
jgi:dihydroxyacetone kinase-like predicted kinase